ncbi:MAG: aminotransferase class IV [Chitinophagales bacterium]|nr:aminotransferase class IV [Chitinophagales bacterium]MCZ2393698.1 aminotransferase class IV [Chitinophagales bacterium]
MEFVETILFDKGKIDLLEFHMSRLKWGLIQNGYLYCQDIINYSQSLILNSVSDCQSKMKIRFLLSIDLENSFTGRVELSPISKQGTFLFNLGVYSFKYKEKRYPWNAKILDRTFYFQASNWASANGYDDAIILNEYGHVVETTIFNIYILKENIIYTPPLMDMPVKGVFRSWLMSNTVFPLIEKPILVDELYDADIILLTNALRGIQIGKI